MNKSCAKLVTLCICKKGKTVHNS